MGMCKGNRGNLMQHWTLCECLIGLQARYESLHFVTTHSMSPWAIPVKNDNPGNCRSIFLRAGTRLGNLNNPSSYELAWRNLSVRAGLPYPSSAAFAVELWKGGISVALCEADSRTADEIEGWLADPQVENKLQHNVPLRGDWRASLISPLFLKSGAVCIYLEMDPMRYDTRPYADRKSTDPATLYPDDIEMLIQHIANVVTPIVLQISSFSTQNNIIPLDSQRQSLEGILIPAGFSLHSEVRVMQQMASFVFIRNCQLSIPSLGALFNDWLGGIQ